jgi:protein-L-isoaspartate(D-aspartate) O-methyltransferase
MDAGLSRMPVHRSAVESGVVRPQFGWGAMAVTDRGSLAYLTLRPVEDGAVADGTAWRRYEVGVIGHGLRGDELADQTAREIRAWDRDFRQRAVRIEIQPADAEERLTGQFSFGMPHNRLAITWE